MPEADAPPGLPPLREIIRRHGLSARRSLGQNFLLDLNLTRRVARAAGDLSSSVVIEVGSGPGGLTRALLQEGALRVIAIERDERCIGALTELASAYPGRLEIVAGDALETDTAALAAAVDGPVRIVANLPYNIATPLLIRWLRRIDCYRSLTLMFQKEVALRLAAAPRSSAYGRLSIIAQWLCTVRCAFDIPPQAFVPAPKVTSTVVHLAPREEPLGDADMETLERVTAAAFGQRRKMLRSSLKTLGADVPALIEAAGVAPTARAEELDIGDFCALARALDAAGD